MLLCSVSTPEDNSAHRVWERLRQKASELKGEVTKDAFFKRHGLFEHTWGRVPQTLKENKCLPKKFFSVFQMLV